MPASTNNSRRTYVIPTCDDILCGRGNIPFQHPGNKKLREKIANTLDSYNLCQTRQGRSTIIRETIRYILVEQGGRFLKADKNGEWYDGGVEAAKGRVSTAFRDARVPNKVKCMEALKQKKVNTVINDPFAVTSLPFSLKNNNFTSCRRDSLSSFSAAFVDHILGHSDNHKRGSLDCSISSINTEMLSGITMLEPLPRSEIDNILNIAAGLYEPKAASRESLDSSISTIDYEKTTSNDVKDCLDFGGRNFFCISDYERANANRQSSSSALNTSESSLAPRQIIPFPARSA